ncbi:MAG TPA: radical SAM protein, partial [Bacteroidales bacterium]|nr:radical SAM protein [Bacteroidales bacterium]
MSMLNLVRLFASYFLSRVLRKAVHSGAPFAITLEPTNRCNLHCPECPSGAQSMSRPRGFMELETYKMILASLDRGTSYLNLYFQGEPFLHPDFFEMVRLAKEKGLYVNTSTNGHFLDPENARKTIASHLDRIIISLDGADQPAYGSYRTGGSLKTVQDGIRNLAEARKRAGTRKPGIVAQFLVLKTNEYQLPEMKKLARELGADRLEIKSAQFYDFELGHPLMPEGKKYNRYRIRVNGSL